MTLRFLALVVALLLPGMLPVAVPASRAPGAISVRAARLRPDAGAVIVTMRWNQRHVRKRGEKEAHLVVLARTAEGWTRVRDEPVDPPRTTRARYRIDLTARERSRIAGSPVMVAATFKHDHDGGLFDRAWYDGKVAGAGPRTAPAVASSSCGAIGPWADLEECDLVGANLAGADLAGANLFSADLDGANLDGANLEDAVLANAALNTATLASADLSYAYLPATILSNADLALANLSDANLSNAHLNGANLSGANLSGATLYSADLTQADLSGAVLTGANLTGAIYCDTIMPDGSTSYYDC